MYFTSSNFRDLLLCCRPRLLLSPALSCPALTPYCVFLRTVPQPRHFPPYGVLPFSSFSSHLRCLLNLHLQTTAPFQNLGYPDVFMWVFHKQSQINISKKELSSTYWLPSSKSALKLKKIFLIKVSLIYNVVLISDVQHNDFVICMHMYSFCFFSIIGYYKILNTVACVIR